MSFGRITGHLMAARELARRHDSTSVAQILAVEAIVSGIDGLLLVVRRIHHAVTLGRD